MNKFAVLFCLILSFCPGYSFSQTKKQAPARQAPARKAQAFILATQAQAQADSGHAGKAVKLLQQAIKLDPSTIDYPYELAYVYSANKDFTLAQSYLQPLMLRKDVTDLIYELAGNCYENMHQPEKASDAYRAGLKKFPSSARLCLECGLAETSKKEYNRALVYFEMGIQSDPAFASNYYWAAKLFCHSTESVWGMIYGELFINIERGSPRSAEISKLLFDTYKSQIKFRKDSMFTVHFSKEALLPVKDTAQSRAGKMLFGVGVYEPTLAIATLNEVSITLASLSHIRQNFVKEYYKNGLDKTFPNALFEFQKQVLDAGQMEAYTYWLLMEGDRKEFTDWHYLNSAKWLEFGEWFKDHPLELDKKRCFYRGQY